jgi:hypothetical protein
VLHDVSHHDVLNIKKGQAFEPDTPAFLHFQNKKGIPEPQLLSAERILPRYFWIYPMTKGAASGIIIACISCMRSEWLRSLFCPAPAPCEVIRVIIT